MRRILIRWWPALLAGNLAAQDQTALHPEPDSGATRRHQERWSVQYEPTTATSHYGIPCVGGSGESVRRGDTVTGRLVSDAGGTVRFSGQVAEDGSIELGIASSPNTAAQFRGTMGERSAHGSWTDRGGCRGTWNSWRNTE